MKDHLPNQLESLDRPYPILARFKHRMVPLLLAFIGVLVLTTSLAMETVQEKIYLHLSQVRAQGLAEGVNRIAPESWVKLLAGEAPTPADYAALQEAFEIECQQFRVAMLKVYDLERRTIFATDPSKIGEVETGDNLKTILQTKEGLIATEVIADGTTYHELYVPLELQGEMRLVFELYEPTSFFDELLIQAIEPILLYPSLLLVLLVVSQGVMMRQAQRDIDQRTKMINQLRERLESLVSRSAVQAVHQVRESGQVPSELVECSLLYSDIRSFSSFAEQRSPGEVVAFLNEIMELQVQAIHEQGGDVDKMIGDAVLARFQGIQKEERALRAALQIQRLLQATQLPRGLGIGVYSGAVIAGGIGPQNRFDYTIIGDAVNVSARLCSLAQVGEIVVDCETAQQSGVAGFSEPTRVTVKGRQGELLICKFLPTSHS